MASTIAAKLAEARTALATEKNMTEAESLDLAAEAKQTLIDRGPRTQRSIHAILTVLKAGETVYSTVKVRKTPVS